MKASPSWVEKFRSSTMRSTSARPASLCRPCSGFTASRISVHCDASASRNAERMSGWSSTISAVQAFGECSYMARPWRDSISSAFKRESLPMLGSFAKRYAAARAADAAELEQALLRAGIYFVLGLYYVAVSWDGRTDQVGLSPLVVSTTTQVVSLG